MITIILISILLFEYIYYLLINLYFKLFYS